MIDNQIEEPKKVDEIKDNQIAYKILNYAPGL